MKILKKIQSNSRFYKIQKQNFFLKFLENKSLLKIGNQQSNKSKNQSVDLNDLLNEKNVKLNFRDILTDFHYFKRQYYYTPNDSESEKIEVMKQKEKLPWDREETTFKKVFHFLFIKDKMTVILLLLLMAIGFNIFSFLITWKYERFNRANVEMLQQIGQAKDDISERKKHNESKWKNYK